MELRIENAYYREGAVKHGIVGFLGTEITRYQVRPRGLGLIAVEATLPQRPRDQPPVQQLLRTSHMHYRYYRFFYAVVFSKRRETGGAVLLGAESSHVTALVRYCLASRTRFAVANPAAARFSQKRVRYQSKSKSSLMASLAPFHGAVYLQASVREPTTSSCYAARPAA